MQKKIYQIENTGYILKKDLTVDESDKVQKLLNSLYSAGDNYVRENMPAGEIKEFLSMVLEPEKDCDRKNEPDFGKAMESVVLEVIKDFFLMRIRLAVNITGYFRNLMKEPGVQLPDLTN